MKFTVCCAVLCIGVSFCVSSANGHPIVPGFERFHVGPEGDARVGGRLLASELNCTSCHAADVAKKQAPILDGVGTRARVSHLRKFLADPQAVKPGTTMPSLFANDPDRDAKVEALVHFLATTGTVRQARSDLKSLIRGRETYAKIGCAVCHGPRDVTGEPTPFPNAVPLGNVKSKYTIPGLAAFLANPLQSRPAGRMPHLLKPAEANDVANYLLQGQRMNLPPGRGTASYKYFEGGWDKLPDFDKLKAKVQGIGVAFEVGGSKQDSNYAFRFDGYIRIDAAGAYKLTLSSDDGSRLVIDDRIVIDNDGVHATIAKSVTIELTKGVHKVRVDFFQGGGESVLEVEIEGRNLGRQPLATLVAPTEADLDRKTDATPVKDEDTLTINQTLVDKGRTLFASSGCANCHQLKAGSAAIEGTLKAPTFASLKPAGGCLSATTPKGLPRYDLSAAQVRALTAAVGGSLESRTDAKSVIASTMLTFNCYACHSRDKIGGPTETTNSLFVTTTPEMGDEGRVPPPLDGVGAKLTTEYLKKALDKGADDRPYMHTGMPGFGDVNVGRVIAAFAELDHLPAVGVVNFGDLEPKVKSAGRHMVGAQAFGCIKCHTFAGQKAEGVQGIDMLAMPKRLKRDWFHAYCVDPQKVRPGTRMPTGWPMGQSTLPKVLDGGAATQIEAIWVYLNAKDVAIPAGMGKKFMPLTPIDEAIIYRNFIQGAGSRAIGVGYPEKLNLAFDANELRLAMIWKGGFIDAARHWTDRGVGFEGPLGDDVIAFPANPNFAVLADANAAWPTNAKAAGQKFLGYTLAKDERPTFRYAVSGATIEDFMNPSGKGNPTFIRTLNISSGSEVIGLYYRAAVGTKITSLKDGWYQLDGWKLRIAGGEPSLRVVAGKTELLVPIKGKSVKIVQEYAW